MSADNVLMSLVLLAGAAPADPLSDGEVLQQAQTAFSEGVSTGDERRARRYFRRAARSYEELRHRGIENAALYLNQGNAYLLADDLPRTVLAYRRGLRFAPADHDLRENLDYARAQVVYATPDDFARPGVDRWPDWLPRPSVGLRLALTLLFYSLACVGFTRWRMTRLARPLAFGLFALLLALPLSATLAYDEWQRRQDLAHPLVVVASDGAKLLRGDGYRYPPRYETPLNRGVEARLMFRRGDWVQIALSGGEVGWLPLEEVWVDES